MIFLVTVTLSYWVFTCPNTPAAPPKINVRLHIIAGTV